MTNILLLEDDETIAFGIQKALEKKGYHLLLCSCIEEAKQAFSPAVHLILLDLNLPDGSGYSFCQWAKKQRDVPIIFLTICRSWKPVFTQCSEELPIPRIPDIPCLPAETSKWIVRNFSGSL